MVVAVATDATDDLRIEGIMAMSEGEGEEPMMPSMRAVVVEVAVEMAEAENDTTDDTRHVICSCLPSYPLVWLP